MNKDNLVLATGIGLVISNLVNMFGVPKLVLFAFMLLDFISGLLVAGYFKNSTKTDTGTLSSKIGYQGICKKMLILVFVTMGTLLDILLDTHYISNGVCFAFILNEVISICENAGLMGVKMPNVISSAIDVLKGKELANDNSGN